MFMSSPAPIPDILLSQAKDDRYISEVSSLLSQIASVCILPLCSDRRHSSSRGGNDATSAAATAAARATPNLYGGGDDDQDDDRVQLNFIHSIRPELNLLASIIVHSSAFICYNRATNNESRSTLGMGSLNLEYRLPETKKRREYPTPSTISSIIDHFRNTWNINHFRRMVFLQTIIPYILQRVARGGWLEDLRGLVVTNRSESIINIDDAERVLRNDERLRGSARRRLFEEQRRMMLQSSSASQRNTPPGLRGNAVVENEIAHHTNHIENAIETVQSTVQISRTGSIHAHDRQLLKRIASLSWNVLRVSILFAKYTLPNSSDSSYVSISLQKFALATSSLSHGAHSLPTRHNSDAATNERLDRTTKIITWFLRLHLAHFYWNGMYPSILHRLTGGVISTGAPVVANRPTYKPIAAIILFQAGTALARATAEASIEVAHFIQIAFFRWRRSRRRQMEQQQSSSDASCTQSIANTERAEYLDLIEEHVPGIGSININSAFGVRPTTMTMTVKENHTQQSTEPTTNGLPCCGICLNERVHPSVPSVCGHVFCWSCILHWVSNVRAECPLCRAETRRQDIIPLYNYP